MVWPSNAVTDVLLSAEKTFYSTGSKGNFTFKILYNGATDQETDVIDDPVDTGIKADAEPDLDQITQQRSKVKAAGTPDRAPGDAKTLGRKRR